jgi:SAM-dependent methyltransferase
MIDADAFNTFEADGWEEAADAYAAYLAEVTATFAEPLLDAAGVGAGTSVLDVASGTGTVAAAAVARGAQAVGVDVAESMVRLAAGLHPDVEFVRGDAESLPFDDGSFDAVVFGFGLLHMGRPERAAAELARVLRPGGRAALTVWNDPSRSRLHGVVLESIAEVGAVPPADVPPGPPLFRFADDGELTALLAGAGFDEVEVRAVEHEHEPPSADALWDGILGGAVRLRITVLGQDQEVRERIRAAFDRRLAAEGGAVRVSAKLGSGRKP